MESRKSEAFCFMYEKKQFGFKKISINKKIKQSWIKEKHLCIFPCASTEKSTQVLFCYFVAKKSKIAWRS